MYQLYSYQKVEEPDQSGIVFKLNFRRFSCGEYETQSKTYSIQFSKLQDPIAVEVYKTYWDTLVGENHLFDMDDENNFYLLTPRKYHKKLNL